MVKGVERLYSLSSSKSSLELFWNELAPVICLSSQSADIIIISNGRLNSRISQRRTKKV